MKRLWIFILMAGLAAAGLIFWTVIKERPKVVTVTIPEGATVAEINQRLHEVGVLNATSSLPQSDEGYLFPDTYNFYAPSTVGAIEEKLQANFKSKTASLVPPGKNLKTVIIIASLIEKEARAEGDRRIISGIIEKRLAADMPLQIDATICYIKPAPCLPLMPADYRIDSPYNTYEHKGLPPAPIDNPGFLSIEAALNPESSPYWYYLSDRSGRIVYARTLDEQERNVVKYLAD